MANALLGLRHQVPDAHMCECAVECVCVRPFKCHHYRAHHRLHGKCPECQSVCCCRCCCCFIILITPFVLRLRLRLRLQPALPAPSAELLRYCFHFDLCPPAASSACQPARSSTILTLLTKLHKLSAFVCLSGAGLAQLARLAPDSCAHPQLATPPLRLPLP